MDPTGSAVRMEGTLARAPGHVSYQPRPAVTLEVLVPVVATATGWTPATVRAYLKLTHDKSPVAATKRLLAALVAAGARERATALHDELAVALVPHDDCIDRLDADEQELDGRENEAQLLRRIQDLPRAERVVAWRTERRLRLALIDVNRRIIARNDRAILGGL